MLFYFCNKIGARRDLQRWRSRSKETAEEFPQFISERTSKMDMSVLRATLLFTVNFRGHFHGDFRDQDKQLEY